MHLFEIGQRFVQYYQSKGFEFLPSASLLHSSIPMTFVMSAGLAQIEMAIDQQGRRTGDRYVLLQNCFRHFDIDRIGKSKLHLSLFEMPGAFAFGRNTREDTVQRMWHLLTAELKIDPNWLWVSYFAGGKMSGHEFDEDVETWRAWQKMGVPRERIVGLGVRDNFWKQGAGLGVEEPIRKCGPNTEVFFDRGPELRCGPKCKPGCGCERFVEFANSLFICWEIDEETRTLRPMADPFAETVIGTERVAMITEGKSSVFEIESIQPLIEHVRSFYDWPIGESVVNLVESERVLVDYVRALVFLTADHAPSPGKGGRKRIMRHLVRGVLTQQKVLQITDSARLPSLIDKVLSIYGNQHPRLTHAREPLLDYFSGERARFERTLGKGYRRLDHLLEQNSGCTLSGEQILDLVKNCGVPLSLVRVSLAERELEFKEREYRMAFEEWRRALASAR